MLAPGDISISPLDMNVEQGRIETPFKPIMRFGTPIFDASGTAAGDLRDRLAANRAGENGGVDESKALCAA